MNLTEEDLKRQAVQFLRKDFVILEDVPGTYLVDQAGVRVDYLLYPCEHLISAGFMEEWFGLEVKAIDDFSVGDAGKKSRLIWQAITYAQSKFTIQGALTRPAFVLVYVGDHRQDDTSQVDEKRVLWARASWRALLTLGQYANVGQLEFSPHKGWEIWFAGGKYFGQRSGKGNLNLGMKRYVGSI